MIKSRVLEDVRNAVSKLGEDPELVFIDRPRQAEHGDYTTNVALRAGHVELADKVCQKISED